jgi:DNA-binding winged helix-turn-helix (wHTH) protein
VPLHTFGVYEFDPAARLLTRGGEPVHLTAKAIDLLLLLVSRRPAAVAKKMIQQSLWPDTFVSDVSLTTLVFELRGALGESARKPRFIRTVHGYGYAFQSDDGTSDTDTRGTPFCIIHEGREVDLQPGENFLGRAHITVAGVVALIEDCGSRNGTWVRGVRTVGSVRLDDGDDIVLAGIRVMFRVLGHGRAGEVTE